MNLVELAIKNLRLNVFSFRYDQGDKFLKTQQPCGKDGKAICCESDDKTNYPIDVQLLDE